jgi:hypothetical protein
LVEQFKSPRGILKKPLHGVTRHAAASNPVLASSDSAYCSRHANGKLGPFLPFVFGLFAFSSDAGPGYPNRNRNVVVKKADSRLQVPTPDAPPYAGAAPALDQHGEQIAADFAAGIRLGFAGPRLVQYAI